MKHPVALEGFIFRLDGASLQHELLAKAERHRKRRDLIQALLEDERADSILDKMKAEVELGVEVPRRPDDPDAYRRNITAQLVQHERLWKRMEHLSRIVRPEDEYMLKYSDFEFLDSDYVHVPYDL